LQAAMREFRARRFQQFQSVRQQTAHALRDYHNQLRAQLGHISQEDIQFSSAEELLRQPLHMGSSVRHQDPMRLSFWH
jgi:hypothetical protein